MLRLIKKDIRFVNKYIIIALLYSIFVPIFLTFDEDPSSVGLLSFLLPVVSLGLIIGKMCYIEDSDDIKMFLKSLPYKNSSIISSKFIELLIFDVISIIYVTLVQIILKLDYSIEKIIDINIMVGSCLIIYYSNYLFLYFKKNYNAAQNTIYVLIALVMMAIFASSKMSPAFIENYQFFNIFYITIFLAILALITFSASVHLLIRKK